MVVDAITFNGELDLLEIRLNILDQYVDKFVITESPLSFSFIEKPLYFKENEERFSKWKDKIIYNLVDSFTDERILNLMHGRDYVPSDKSSFKMAFYQKESITNHLSWMDDEDILYYGDCDEIWKPKIIDDKPYKLRQLAYAYYLNNRSTEDWHGTVVTKYKNVKDGCLNDLRAKPTNILQDGGWHFTNLGGIDELRRKIAMYDHQEINTPWVTEGLEQRLKSNKDFLGRDFTFWKDESDLPEYILENRDKYANMFI